MLTLIAAVQRAFAQSPAVTTAKRAKAGVSVWELYRLGHGADSVSPEVSARLRHYAGQ